MENGNEWGDRIQREIPIRRISLLGFPGGTRGKEPICQCRRGSGLILGLGRSLGGGHGNPLQYSCLENPVDRGAWSARVHGDCGGGGHAELYL